VIGAVDIGGTKIAAGMVDEDGTILSRVESPTEPERGFEDALSRISAMLRETSRHAGDPFCGIGIGCTGPIDPFTGIVGKVDFLHGWEGGNLAAGLGRMTPTLRLSERQGGDQAAVNRTSSTSQSARASAGG
jgi:glucokinase